MNFLLGIHTQYNLFGSGADWSIQYIGWILIWQGVFPAMYTHSVQLVKKYNEPAHSTVLLLGPNLAGEFSGRYTHPLYSNHNNWGKNTNAPPALPLSGQRLGPSGLKGGA